MRLPPFPLFRLRGAVSLLASLLAASVATTAAGAPAAASASAPRPLELEWQSHVPGCDAENVVELALSSLGPAARLRHIAATAQVWRDGDDWVVQLDTRSSMHTGRRILRSPSCADVRQALALLLAMILESEDDPDSVELPEIAGSSSEQLQLVRDSAPERGRALYVVAQAGANYGFGLQPERSWGFAGGAGLNWRFLEASVRVAHWPDTRASVRDSDGYIEVSRSDFALALCASLDLGDWLSIVPCVAPKLTFLNASAVDTTAPRGNSATLPGVNGTLEVRYWLPGQLVFLSLGSGVVWENSQTFVVQRTCEDGSPPQCIPRNEPVDQTPGFGGSLSLSIGARF